MLADVVDLRSDCSIPLNVNEGVYRLTITLRMQLYDEDVISRCSMLCSHVLDL